MNELKSPDKPFEISKWAVKEAWEKVKANKGAPGVDGVSIEGFEADLHNNLYKVWNRMSSGSYFPPPVRAVEIPKPHGGGTRMHLRQADPWLGGDLQVVRRRGRDAERPPPPIRRRRGRGSGGPWGPSTQQSCT